MQFQHLSVCSIPIHRSQILKTRNEFQWLAAIWHNSRSFIKTKLEKKARTNKYQLLFRNAVLPF